MCEYEEVWCIDNSLRTMCVRTHTTNRRIHLTHAQSHAHVLCVLCVHVQYIGNSYTLTHTLHVWMVTHI